MKIALFLLLSSLSITQAWSQAQPLKLNVNDYGFLTSFPPLQDILDDYLITVEEDLNNQQPINDPNQIMKSTANSTAMASRGLGNDYASDMDNFMLGVSLGAAADFEKNKGLKDQDISGLGGAAAIMLGKKINEKTNVYFNIGGVSKSQTFESIEDTDLNSEITTFGVGAHARYQWIEGSGDSLWGWGGVRVHFGYQYIKNKLEFTNELNEDINVDLGASSFLEGRLKGNPVYNIETEIHSFPLEISSNVSFLKVFTLFGGAGADFNFGQSRGRGDLKARAFSPLTCTGGGALCTNLNLPELEVVGNLNTTKKVDPMVMRAFGGLQLNFGTFKIYGQVNQALGSKVMGASAGIRAVF